MTYRTLSQHGLAHRFNGWPITDDYGDVIGYLHTDKWTEADLSQAHWDELAEWFAQDRAAFDEVPDRAAYWTDARLLYGLMDRNGVEHDHLRGKPLIDRRPAYGYECGMCGSAIIAKEPGDYQFVGGPIDGRWIVTGGRQTWEVPVPPPVSVLASADPPRLTFETVTYTRHGDCYYAPEPPK